MAHVRVVSDWRPYRWFPWVERRKVFLSLDTMPGIPVDISAFWTERRLAVAKPESRP